MYAYLQAIVVVTFSIVNLFAATAILLIIAISTMNTFDMCWTCSTDPVPLWLWWTALQWSSHSFIYHNLYERM